ncbi:poly [ADP-ribose] polymerase tankyrase-2-like isoform X4 [Branchiostoma floridae]|uniref:Poly [ADP-ribose] polymerase tankyrase-2-like isoform X4 n=1 Tax=Branchiostoma floridae TaxID=7739 RepID=A0A9J7MXC9_BRAFL|nr:poly [ADP-ribose] polymerase tankyrase-2-like isoform X4 [Branchiostoma floridae]
MAVTDPNIDLFDAVRNGSLRGVEAALKAGADIDFEYACCEESSPGTFLFNVSCMGDVDTARLLLRKGASLVKRSTRSAFAPLHGAAFNGRTEVVELLIHHGATVDIRDRFQNTPLMRACNYNHLDTVRRLIELGARPDLTGGQCQGMRYYEEGTEIGKGENEESWKLIEEARSELLRCCNPKCGKPDHRSTLKLCGRCKLTRYCSRECQIQHWSVGHKKCCGQDVYL